MRRQKQSILKAEFEIVPLTLELRRFEPKVFTGSGPENILDLDLKISTYLGGKIRVLNSDKAVTYFRFPSFNMGEKSS